MTNTALETRLFVQGTSNSFLKDCASFMNLIASGSLQLASMARQRDGLTITWLCSTSQHVDGSGHVQIRFTRGDLVATCVIPYKNSGERDMCTLDLLRTTLPNTSLSM